jgi:hypothetical protein
VPTPWTALVAACALALVAGPAAGPERAPTLSGASAGAAGVEPQGGMVATISPDGDGHRDAAWIRFHLDRPAAVHVLVAAVGVRRGTVLSRTVRAGAGWRTVRWAPRRALEARTYVTRFVVRDRAGRVRRYGFGDGGRTPAIRVLGIEAAFGRDSYAPGDLATMRLETDEPVLTLDVRRVGGGRLADPAADAMNGVPVTEPATVEGRGRPRRIRIRVGDWPSGVYLARLEGRGGRAGYAPFVVRPRSLGEHRVAVVLPTFTWQAYNFRDTDGDGYGETWYEGRTRETALGRPHLGTGIPPHFRNYDLGFLAWLARAERAGRAAGADFLGDADLHALGDAAALARAYDLIVFPGHHEYVTTRAFEAVRGFRDRGGNLMFLSANNFFWRVVRRGATLTRVAKWRDLGRPEAALLGVQYLASDRGERRRSYVVRNAGAAPWLFEGTGLADGSHFGRFGIEIDAVAPSSPAGTIVLAEIPHLFGPGRTAQMTYYETRRGARVFAAGAFTLAGRASRVPERQLLDNLWARLSKP